MIRTVVLLLAFASVELSCGECEHIPPVPIPDGVYTAMLDHQEVESMDVSVTGDELVFEYQLVTGERFRAVYARKVETSG